MATAIDKTSCITCKKGKIVYKCEGCSQYFCLIHLPDHHQELGIQLNAIEDEYNLFRETLGEQAKSPDKHCLVEQINQWENDSIKKIEQTAEETRQLLIKYINENLDDLETKLVKLMSELEHIRIENDFNEIDLNKFKRNLKELQEHLSNPSNIFIEEESSSFINKICVLTADDKASLNTKSTPIGNLFGTTRVDLAKQSTTNSVESKVFAGQGSLIFGSTSFSTMETKNKGDDDDEDDDDSYEPNISFKPIVTLKPVVVKTGEEDENILFCERGKLYRFDTSSNQMKERGIGEMKILQHKTTKLCRILMRREQVLKLCANHTIAPQMELKRHQGAENAYVWSATDLADGEAKYETLCIRFKSSEIAERFVKIFNQAKETNAKAHH